MLLIECPFCGSRDEDEFRCGGESHIERPIPAEAIDDARWADYLHNRTNPRGLNFERWWHGAGCGQWFNMARDTLTHRIVAIYRMGTAPPVGVRARGADVDPAAAVSAGVDPATGVSAGADPANGVAAGMGTSIGIGTAAP